MELAELLGRQRRLTDTIANTVTNLKKSGQAKLTKVVLQGKFSRLRDNFLLFQEFDAKIYAPAESTKASVIPYITEEQYQTAETQFEATADFIGEMLARADGGELGDPNVSQAINITARASAKLPQIHLPTFDGSFEKWKSFRDQFQSIIVDNRSLANVDRLHYLRASLTGEACDAIKHLAITDGNLSLAWELIVSRFDDKRRLINNHLHALFTLPHVAGDTSKGIRSLRDKANSALQALRNLKRPVDEWSDVLVYTVTQRLDRATREAWELHTADSREYSAYPILDSFLQTRLRALDALIPATLAGRSGGAGNISKGIASHTVSIGVPACRLCRAHHSLYTCSTFLGYAPAKRVEVVQRANLCANCLRSDHGVKSCPSRRSCWKCQKRHHTLLHLPIEDRSTTVADLAGSTPRAAATGSEDIASHIMTGGESPKSAVLLATARVLMHDSRGRCMRARALVDQGSAATFVSNAFSRRLQFQRLPTDTSIIGIGNTRAMSHATALLKVTPHFDSDRSITTTTYIMKSLTKYLPWGSSVAQEWEHVNDLQLADPDSLNGGILST